MYLFISTIDLNLNLSFLAALKIPTRFIKMNDSLNASLSIHLVESKEIKLLTKK